VHYGRAQETLDARHRVMSKAATLHPERFVHGLPKRIEAPSTVWINPPVGPGATSAQPRPATQNDHDRHIREH
jgi:hypothetical protein